MSPRIALTLSNFFSAAQFFVVLYVIASYLATLIPESATGFVIAGGAFLTLTIFPFVPELVRRVGLRPLLLGATAIASSALLFMAFVPSAVAAILLTLIYCMLQPIISYFYDLLLEATITTEDETGRIRTIFLTVSNFALVLAPLIIGLLLENTNAYWLVLVVASALFVPFLFFITSVKLPEGEAPHFSHIVEVCRCLLRDPDLFAVSVAMVTLQFFYHLAPFFVPLYLHGVLGIPWSELGWIFAVMLLPFLLLEYPVGWLADRVWGDQEIMAMGFFILGTGFASLAFVSVLTPLISIVIVLVVTRVGAALAEATVETHFFRRVSEKDANSVGVFRMMRPVGALTAPLVGSLLLYTSSYAMLFFVTGIGIIAVGVAGALSIKDVR